MAIDIVSDLTKLWRLGAKLAGGDMTLGDVLNGDEAPAEEEEAAAKTAKPACRKTHGCTEGAGHSGRCCIDATVTEEK